MHCFAQVTNKNILETWKCKNNVSGSSVFWWGSFWSSWGWFLMVTAVTGISTTDSTGKTAGRLRLDHQQSIAIVITNGLENEKTATKSWWWDIMLMFRILAGWGTQGLNSNRQIWLLSPDNHRKWEDVTVAGGPLEVPGRCEQGTRWVTLSTNLPSDVSQITYSS